MVDNVGGNKTTMNRKKNNKIKVIRKENKEGGAGDKIKKEIFEKE